MAKEPPVVYLLHGEDEFAIAQFIAEIKAKLGDPSVIEMNVTHLDGRSLSFNELVTATSAMPFLARRRLAILTHPLAYTRNPAARQRFLDYLETIPSTTALVLVEYHALTNDRDRRQGQLHWLEEWAQQSGERVYLRLFNLPTGPGVARWIQERAKQVGGQFSYQAAGVLSSLVGEDSRLADQEIQKLLTYVNFQRPVEPDDVEHLTALSMQGDIFAMVDALGNRNARVAMSMLHRLLETEDPLRILGMVVRQFRLLLLAREILDRGGGESDVARQIHIHPYVAKKVTAQARHLVLPALEGIYRSLLGLDLAIKTGQMDASLSLDMFIAEQT
ncbi:MAG: DNA polymerase III subunit delta [Anaerolineales bacterium]